MTTNTQQLFEAIDLIGQGRAGALDFAGDLRLEGRHKEAFLVELREGMIVDHKHAYGPTSKRVSLIPKLLHNAHSSSMTLPRFRISDEPHVWISDEHHVAIVLVSAADYCYRELFSRAFGKAMQFRHPPFWRPAGGLRRAMWLLDRSGLGIEKAIELDLGIEGQQDERS